MDGQPDRQPGLPRNPRSGATARRRRMLTWAAVWLFALRTLVPIGFMLSVEGSHAALVPCPDYAQLPAALSYGLAAHHGHHHHAHAAPPAEHGGGEHASGAEGHGLCPFAAAAHGQWHAPDAGCAAAVPLVERLSIAAAPDATVARPHPYTSPAPRGPPRTRPV